jgi:hypothetical protein
LYIQIYNIELIKYYLFTVFKNKVIDTSECNINGKILGL